MHHSTANGTILIKNNDQPLQARFWSTINEQIIEFNYFILIIYKLFIKTQGRSHINNLLGRYVYVVASPL